MVTVELPPLSQRSGHSPEFLPNAMTYRRIEIRRSMLVREWLYESASVKAQHVSSKNLQNIPGQAAKCLPQKSGEMEGKRDLHALRNHLFESQNLKLLEEQITAMNSGFVDIRELARFTACIAFITIQSLHSSQKSDLLPCCAEIMTDRHFYASQPASPPSAHRRPRPG